MKLKIDDLFLDNSLSSMNLERRFVVTIPYQHKYYLLISEMNVTFKQTNPRNFAIQNEKDMDLDSDDTVLEKLYSSERELMKNYQEQVLTYIETINDTKWIQFCEEKYFKHKKELTEEKLIREKTRFRDFNTSLKTLWNDLNSKDFTLGNDQPLFAWEIFWKNLEMQKLSNKLSYKPAIYIKPRKI